MIYDDILVRQSTSKYINIINITLRKEEVYSKRVVSNAEMAHHHQL